MGGLRFKGAILCPEIDRVADAGATTLVDHLGRLWARDVEFEIGIFLPVAEEKGKLEEESVVGLAEGSECLGTGVAVEATFESLTCANELFPVLETIRVGFL